MLLYLTTRKSQQDKAALIKLLIFLWSMECIWFSKADKDNREKQNEMTFNQKSKDKLALDKKIPYIS